MNTKAIFTLFTLLTATFIITSFQNATESQTAIIRILEPISGSLHTPTLVISVGDNPVKEITLQRIKSSTLGENTKVIVRELNNLKSQGFVIKSTHGGDYIRTYVLEK